MLQLSKIQKNLKAPKNQRNNFGNYNYRSAEDILEAIKPYLNGDDGITLILSDEIVLIGDRYYVKATATLSDKDGKTASATAYAREPLTKKGMDEAQITGATSSYARKYALNGLFAIDDNKDADTYNYIIQSNNKSIEDARQKYIDLATQLNIENPQRYICDKLKVFSFNSISTTKLDAFTRALEKARG